MDEFYGGYNYTSNCDGKTVSAADNIEDVDEDDVLLIDGLTKRFRLPGWRIAWIVGPKEFIKAIGSCGSYLDGGANVPFQEAAIPMLEPNRVLNEMKALQTHFREKRDYVLGRLKDIGFKIKHVPDSTFYVWLALDGLPETISDGLNFFQSCLEEKVIVGEFLESSTFYHLMQLLSLAPLSLSSAAMYTHIPLPTLISLLLNHTFSTRYLLRPQPRQTPRSFRFSVPSLCALELWSQNGYLEARPGWYRADCEEAHGDGEE